MESIFGAFLGDVVSACGGVDKETFKRQRAIYGCQHNIVGGV